MNSKHAGADEPPSTQTGAKEKAEERANKEPPSARIQEEKRGRDKKMAGPLWRASNAMAEPREQRSWTGGHHLLVHTRRSV